MRPQSAHPLLQKAESCSRRRPVPAQALVMPSVKGNALPSGSTAETTASLTADPRPTGQRGTGAESGAAGQVAAAGSGHARGFPHRLEESWVPLRSNAHDFMVGNSDGSAGHVFTRGGPRVRGGLRSGKVAGRATGLSLTHLGGGQPLVLQGHGPALSPRPLSPWQRRPGLFSGSSCL